MSDDGKRAEVFRGRAKWPEWAVCRQMLNAPETDIAMIRSWESYLSPGGVNLLVRAIEDGAALVTDWRGAEGTVLQPLGPDQHYVMVGKDGLWLRTTRSVATDVEERYLVVEGLKRGFTADFEAPAMVQAYPLTKGYKARSGDVDRLVREMVGAPDGAVVGPQPVLVWAPPQRIDAWTFDRLCGLYEVAEVRTITDGWGQCLVDVSQAPSGAKYWINGCWAATEQEGALKIPQ